MRFLLILVFLFCSVSFISKNQQINFNPKPLKKDIQKLWDAENVELTELTVPDSLYNDILLNRGKIYQTKTEGENSGYAYVGRIYSCRSGGCSMEETHEEVSADDDFEYFDYYIIYDSSLKVEMIRVYNYQATHGHEIAGKGWLKQFIGYTGKTKLELGKNIDSISGATISANAITYSVQESNRYLELLMPILKNTSQNLKVMTNEK